MSAPRKLSARFETRDIRFVPLLVLMVILFGILGSAAFFGHFFDRALRREALENVPAGSPLAQMQRLPPEPRLQSDPAVDMIRLRDVENVILSNYSWIDPETGKVRIPIDRAMAILAERGLPGSPKGSPQ